MTYITILHGIAFGAIHIYTITSTIFNTHVIQMNRGTTVPHHLLPASIDSPVAITITGAGAIVGATSSEALRNGRKTFEAEVQSVFCF